MAEEKQVEEQKPVEKPALTDIEVRAQEQGWVPQDEWDGEPDQWRPAKEFLDRGELFKKIDEQNRTIKEFRKTLQEFAKHHDKVKKVEYERALADLKAAKKTALNEGDADAVVDLDEKIDLVREAQREASTHQVNIPNAPAELNPVFVAWRERNSWYDNNKAMRVYADRIGNELGATGQYSATDLLAHVEREVKKEFVEKFKNPNREKASSVEGSSNKGGGKGKDTYELNDVERRAMERFVRDIPGFTKEKYIKELQEAKARGL